MLSTKYQERKVVYRFIQICTVLKHVVKIDVRYVNEKNKNFSDEVFSSLYYLQLK